MGSTVILLEIGILINMSYERNVFINCPFDKKYFSLLRPLLFTIIYLRFNPRIALERSDSGETRLNKICELIQESKYSIHDLSRLKLSSKEGLARHNMPFELGLDIGCRNFSNQNHRDKRCLILEKEKYRYMIALSDISGCDIKSHNDDPYKLVQQVRDWFVETVGLKKVKGASEIWYQFNDFALDFYEKRILEGFSVEEANMMAVPEYVDYIKEWCDQNIFNVA